MQEEIWKDVVGYEGLYKISGLGRIKSLIFSNERIMKPRIHKTGYYIVNLVCNKISKTKSVHQLVAEAFLGHTPCGMKLVVNHINFNKLDNRVENLEIVTSRENTNRRHIESTSKYVGVFWAKKENKWISSIMLNGKTTYLGSFNKELDAHLAYKEALALHLEGKSVQIVIDKYAPKFSSDKKGVYWHGKNKKWIAQIVSNKNKKYLGSFISHNEACLAYEEALSNLSLSL